jgi:signal transduction histidine kinase
VIKRLFVKLVLLQLLCAVLVVVTLQALVEHYFRERMYAEFVSHGEVFAKALAKSVEISLIARDVASVQSALDQALKLPNVSWAYVIARDGQVSAHTFVPEFPAFLTNLDGINSGSRSDLDMPGSKSIVTVFKEPVLSGIVGTVYLGFSQDNLHSSIRRMERVILFWIGAVMLLVSGVSTGLTRRILNPIRALTTAAEELGRKSIAEFQDLPIQSSDEIGTLTKAFNTMIQELKGQQAILEERVRRRTEELLNANKKLKEEIAERRLLEGQLVQAQKLESIGQLAAGIAHEINTPIQYVGDNIRFLQDSFKAIDKVLDEWENALVCTSRAGSLSKLVEQADLAYLRREIPKAVEQSGEGVERVASIVKAMKEFSHPGPAEMKAIDINHAIGSTVTVSRNEWKYVAEVVLNLDPDLPAVRCLPGEFNQVMLNLIVNSAHAIADLPCNGNGEVKGTVTVSTRRDRDWVEIRVSDTGVGIPEAVRPRIFTPFFTTKEVGKGTGQGLAIAHSAVVKRHGGTISFETEENKGTTFIVRLPIDGIRGGKSL